MDEATGAAAGKEGISDDPEVVSHEKCSCGENHGDEDANVAPSVVTGEENPVDGGAESGQEAQDAALKGKRYLALCQDFAPVEGNQRRHPDGSVCKAKSEESCPFNRGAEKAETAIKGDESPDNGVSHGGKTVTGKERDDLIDGYLDDVLGDLGEPDDINSEDFAEGCDKVRGYLRDSLIEDFADEDGTFHVDEFEKGREAWAKRQDIEGMVREEAESAKEGRREAYQDISSLMRAGR